MRKKGKNSCAGQNVLSITQHIIYPINNVREAETALKLEENKINSWIQNLHSPDANELDILGRNLACIRKFIAALREKD